MDYDLSSYVHIEWLMLHEPLSKHILGSYNSWPGIIVLSLVYYVYHVFCFCLFFYVLDVYFLTMRTLCDFGVREGKPCFKIFGKEREKKEEVLF